MPHRRPSLGKFYCHYTRREARLCRFTNWGQPAAPAEDPAPPARTEASVDPAASTTASSSSAPPHALVYKLEGIEIRGNVRTRDRVILRYVPFRPGNVLDVEDPERIA